MGGGNVSWAEDVTQDVFVRLLESAASLDLSTPLEGWLLTVTYRLCVDRLKREHSVWGRVRAALMRSLETVAPPVAEARAADEGSVWRQLEASLGNLPPLERAAIVMKYMDERPQTEIAASLGLSKGYVSKLLTRGTSRLRELGWRSDDV
jgi:RNA polymerase sigma-70 factor, ECF subfamily